MKKGILFIAVLILAGWAYAQKTISSDDFGAAGDQVIFSEDTAYVGSVFVGSQGELQQWYFDFLQNHQLDTMEFLAPAMASDSLYPASANLALQDSLLVSGLNITYYNNSASQLTIVGNSFGLDLTAILDTIWFIRTNYTSPLHQAKYIMEYNDVWLEDGAGSYTGYYGDTVPGLGIYVDSFRLNETVTILDSINGFGTLHLPGDSIGALNSYESLRQEIRMTRSFDADVLVENPFFPIFGDSLEWAPVSQFLPQTIPAIHEYYVRYWTRGRQYPVLEFLMDSIGDVQQTRYLYNPTPFIDGIENDVAEMGLQTYPNPVKDRISLQWSTTGLPSRTPTFIDVYDANGKLIQMDSTTKNNTAFTTVGWQSGLYFARITNGKQSQTVRFVVK